MATIDKLLANKKVIGNKKLTKTLKRCLLNNRVYVVDLPSSPQHRNALFNYSVEDVAKNFMPLHDDYIIATGMDVYMVNRAGEKVHISVITGAPFLMFAPYTMWLDLETRYGETRIPENLPRPIQSAMSQAALGLFSALHISNLIATNNTVEHESTRPYTYRGSSGLSRTRPNVVEVDPTKVTYLNTGPKRRGVSGYHLPPHERRGHWRTYRKSGKRIWVDAYRVGQAIAA